MALSRRVTETPQFKAWFGDSKVVDKNGKPLVVYHGTDADPFSSFDTDGAELGSHFGDIQHTESFVRTSAGGAIPDAHIIPVYLAIKNPLRLRDLGEFGAEKVALQLRKAGIIDAATEHHLYVLVQRRGDSDEASAQMRDAIEAAGYDGVVYLNRREGVERDPHFDDEFFDRMTDRKFLASHPGAKDSYVAFRPEQIKSATGNNGDFDASVDDIAFSRLRPDAVKQWVRDHLEAAFNGKRTFGLWDRTVGTQGNKARKSPKFKIVYDKANEFIRDISFFAATAADKAPTLMPKLESIKTLGKGLGDTITGKRQASLKLAAQAIYDGTLAKERFTDSELQRKGLDPLARTFYHEARAAVDTSLEQTAVSTMHRLARGMKLGVSGVRDMGLMQARDAITAVIRAKRDAVGSELANERQLLALKTREYAPQLTDEALAQTLKKHTEKVAELQRRYDELLKAVDDVNDIAGRVVDLQNDAYFPLMRFGEYTVYATEKAPDGEVKQLYFGMFETEAERVKMERHLKVMFPNATVRGGVGNDEYFKLFAGINLDSLEVFAQAMGGGSSEQAVFQSYLRLAVANRSALKRMIQRKEIDGFNNDISRTLAHFLTSNARLSSRNYHWAEAKAAVADIDKEQGDVQKEAVRLLEFIENPQEESQRMRAFNFMWFLAGNISTAILNMTQPAVVTMPYLSRYGLKETAAALKKGGASLDPRFKPDAELKAALKLAEDRGVTAPHEIHNLYGEQQRTILSRDTRVGALMQRGNRLLGEPFALAEAFNRRVTFVAAFEIGRKMTAVQLKKEDVADAFGFAIKAVDDTQFVYNKANRPNWGRGTFGSLIFQFKTYGISSVELWVHLAKQGPEGKRAAALMAAMWLLTAGLLGLPFEEDIEDMLDTLGQSLGWDTNLRATIRDSFTEGAKAILGEQLGGFATEVMLHGVSGALPLDVQARLSLGNMAPATGVAKRSAADKRGKELAELLGPTGGVLTAFFEKIDAFQSGNAPSPMAWPNFIKNAMQAWDMVETGVYRGGDGSVTVKVDKLDAAMKLFGFQPASVARPQRAMSVVMEQVNLQKVVEKDYVQRAAGAIVTGILIDTPEAQAKADVTVDKVFADIERWNARNPNTPVEVTGSQVSKRVNGMLTERSQRVLKAAPKEMRGRIAAQLDDGEDD